LPASLWRSPRFLAIGLPGSKADLMVRRSLGVLSRFPRLVIILRDPFFNIPFFFRHAGSFLVGAAFRLSTGKFFISLFPPTSVFPPEFRKGMAVSLIYFSPSPEEFQRNRWLCEPVSHHPPYANSIFPRPVIPQLSLLSLAAEMCSLLSVRLSAHWVSPYFLCGPPRAPFCYK